MLYWQIKVLARDRQVFLENQALSLNFEVPYFTVSGAQVKYLKVTEKSGYQTTPWVRYVTKNGDYQIRIPEIRKPILSLT